MQLGDEKKEDLKSVAGGTLDKKLETVLVLTEGCRTRVGFRRSCCDERSCSPLGKMSELQITLTKFELLLVFEGHVRKRKEAKPSE